MSSASSGSNRPKGARLLSKLPGRGRVCCSGSGTLDRDRADHADAVVSARLPHCDRHRDVGDRPDGLDVHFETRGIQRFSHLSPALTLFRLALNVSSSRLILLNGNGGTSAAGNVIEAFGNFVVGGNYVIGAVIFLVPIAIQYVVINHGAVRISEVSARFTLDALPGKQMSIDAGMNAGLIDEAEARKRRKQLSAEQSFTAPWTAPHASRSATRWPAF